MEVICMYSSYIYLQDFSTFLEELRTMDVL